MRTFFRTLVLLLAGILGVLRRLCMSFVGENSMRFFSRNPSEWEYSVCFAFKWHNLLRLRLLTITSLSKPMPMKSSSPTVLSPTLYNKLTEEIYTLPLGVGGVTGFRGRSGLLRKRRQGCLDRPSDANNRQKKLPLSEQRSCI